MSKAGPAPSPDSSAGKTYRLALRFRIFLLLGLIFLVIVVTLTFLSTSINPTPPEATWFFVAWLLFMIGFMLWHAWYTVYEIRVAADGTLYFRALLRTLPVDARDVVSIDSPWWNLNRQFPVLRHRGGKVRLLNPMDGFSDFLWTVRSLNPGVEIKGF